MQRILKTNASGFINCQQILKARSDSCADRVYSFKGFQLGTNHKSTFVDSMMDEKWISGFKEKLDQHYAWPALYTFKFIVANNKKEEVKNLFPQHETKEKSSSNGKYTSITVEMMMPSSESIMQVYLDASRIEGIIAL